jgi:Spy/CpxP family protein refolding chaperone
MRTRTTSLIALTALAALLVLPLAADIAEAAAAEKGRSPVDILTHPRLLARYLRLSADQTKTLETLVADLQATVRPLRETGKQLREELYDLLEGASPNACEVGEAALAVHENAEKIKAAFVEFDEKFSAILTPAQLARYEALKEAARLLRGRDDEADL